MLPRNLSPAKAGSRNWGPRQTPAEAGVYDLEPASPANAYHRNATPSAEPARELSPRFQPGGGLSPAREAREIGDRDKPRLKPGATILSRLRRQTGITETGWMMWVMRLLPGICRPLKRARENWGPRQTPAEAGVYDLEPASPANWHHRNATPSAEPARELSPRFQPGVSVIPKSPARFSGR